MSPRRSGAPALLAAAALACWSCGRGELRDPAGPAPCAADAGAAADSGVVASACTPEGRRCDGRTPQRCDLGERWVDDGAPCANVCAAGACVGACKPGATACTADGAAVESCTASGAWETGPPCPSGCLNGACTTCVPGALRCTEDARTPQRPILERCGPDGRWHQESVCADDSRCSGQVCVCSPPACDEGSFHTTGLEILELAAGGEFLYFRHGEGDNRTLYGLNVHTGLEWPSFGTMEPFVLAGGIAADASGAVYWCRERVDAFRTGDLMKGGSSLEPVWCSALALTATHLYVKQADGLYRRALDRPGFQRVGTEEGIVFAVNDAYAFLSSRTRVTSSVSRTPLADLSRSDLVFTRGGELFSAMVADRDQVYVVSTSGLLRAPVAGGDPEPIGKVEGEGVSAVALTDSHVYWSATRYTGGACAEARVYRRHKEGGPATVISGTGSYCGGPLLVYGDRLYAVVKEPVSGTTQLLRIRL